MDAKKALNIVAGQCSKKEYCSFDILKKLQRWELEEKDIAAVMEFLVKNHFLDDTRFAEAYARDKHRFNRWGKVENHADAPAKACAGTYYRTGVVLFTR